MSIWYTAEIFFNPDTRGAGDIVKKVGKKLGIPLGEPYSETSVKEYQTKQNVIVEVSVCNPRYELMHVFTTAVLKHNLCRAVQIHTWYSKGGS